VNEIAMQVVAASPSVVSADELSEDSEGTPEQLALLEQPYMRDPGKTIRQLINETIGKTGENIQVKRFMRFELGT
jgi:elongation factor Ts